MADNNEEYFEYWPGVSGWSRRTVADGIWLNNNTVRPITERTDILKDAIKDLSANTDEHFDNLEMYMYEEFENTSAWVNEEIDNTKIWTMEQIGLAGGFVVADPSGGAVTACPNIEPEDANVKKIYLVPISGGKRKRDLYSEWIVTSADNEPPEWTCIGETVMSLGGYVNSYEAGGTGGVVKDMSIQPTVSGAVLSAIYGTVSAEEIAGVVTQWQQTPDNVHIPSEKLVKDSIDNATKKMSIVLGTQESLEIDVKYTGYIGNVTLFTLLGYPSGNNNNKPTNSDSCILMLSFFKSYDGAPIDLKAQVIAASDISHIPTVVYDFEPAADNPYKIFVKYEGRTNDCPIFILPNAGSGISSNISIKSILTTDVSGTTCTSINNIQGTDSTPTAGSTKAVTSNGIYAATSGAVHADYTQNFNDSQKTSARNNIEATRANVKAGGLNAFLSNVTLDLLPNYPNTISGVTTVSARTIDGNFENYGYILRPDESTYAGKVPVATWENNKGGINWENINSVSIIRKVNDAEDNWNEVNTAITNGSYPIIKEVTGAGTTSVQLYYPLGRKYSTDTENTFRFMQQFDAVSFLSYGWDLTYDIVNDTYEWTKLKEQSALVADGSNAWTDADLRDNPGGAYAIAIIDAVDEIIAQEKHPVLYMQVTEYTEENFLPYYGIGSSCELIFQNNKYKVSVGKISHSITINEAYIPKAGDADNADYATEAGTATKDSENNNIAATRAFKYAPDHFYRAYGYTLSLDYALSVGSFIPLQFDSGSSSTDLPICGNYLQVNSDGSLKASDGWRECTVTIDFAAPIAATNSCYLTFCPVLLKNSVYSGYSDGSVCVIPIPGGNTTYPINIHMSFTITLTEDGSYNLDIDQSAHLTPYCKFAVLCSDASAGCHMGGYTIRITITGKKYVVSSTHPTG